MPNTSWNAIDLPEEGWGVLVRTTKKLAYRTFWRTKQMAQININHLNGALSQYEDASNLVPIKVRFQTSYIWGIDV